MHSDKVFAAVTAVIAVSALSLPSNAAAHEVWLERHGADRIRVFLGEPADPVPPGGDPEFPKLKAPAVFVADPTRTATLSRKADHIEAAVADVGDVRLRDDNVFEPHQASDGKYVGRIFYARAGRTETRAVLDFEVVPVAAGSDDVRVLYKGQPVPNAMVTLINPDRWSKTLKSDAEGKLTLPTPWKGQYIAFVRHSVDEPATLGGKSVAKVTHVATLSFVEP